MIQIFSFCTYGDNREGKTMSKGNTRDRNHGQKSQKKQWIRGMAEICGKMVFGGDKVRIFKRREA